MPNLEEGQEGAERSARVRLSLEVWLPRAGDRPSRPTSGRRGLRESARPPSWRPARSKPAPEGNRERAAWAGPPRLARPRRGGAEAEPPLPRWPRPHRPPRGPRVRQRALSASPPQPPSRRAAASPGPPRLGAPRALSAGGAGRGRGRGGARGGADAEAPAKAPPGLPNAERPRPARQVGVGARRQPMVARAANGGRRAPGTTSPRMPRADGGRRRARPRSPVARALQPPPGPRETAGRSLGQASVSPRRYSK